MSEQDVLPLSVHQAQVRAEVWAWAERLTSDSDNPAAVAANTGPLLAWLEDASGHEDLGLRMRAMRREYLEGFRRISKDAPGEMVANARPFYEFMAAGRQA